MDSLNIQLDIVTAHNARLVQENEQLRSDLQRINHQQHDKATWNVEAKLKVLKIEDERDRSNENLEKLKKRYNTLYQLYTEKSKRCKALEQTFQRQKTLTGLVTKSSLEQVLCERKKESDVKDSIDELQTAQILATKVQKLQKALNEAYDIIDELEFEMETIDFLEMENNRLQTELQNLKSRPIIKTEISYIKADDNDDMRECLNRDSIASTICHECHEQHEFHGDDLDGTILPDSLNREIEMEKNCLRRELLKSRLQNTIRPEILPKPSKEKLQKSKLPNM